MTLFVIGVANRLRSPVGYHVATTDLAGDEDVFATASGCLEIGPTCCDVQCYE